MYHATRLYAGKIGNPYGDPLYEVRITCRTIFTDPNVHQELHDTHVKRFANYFGYWSVINLNHLSRAWHN